MQGMSVTEISHTEIAVQRPFHIKRNSSLRNWDSERYYFLAGYFLSVQSGDISATGNNSHKYINDNHYHHMSRLKPSVWRWKTTSLNRGSTGFLRADWGTDGL